MIAPKIVLLVLLLARFLQMLPMSSLIVSDINTESEVDHGNLQSSENSIDHVEPSVPSPSPVKVRRSTRSTKGIPPNRYGSVTSHQVNVHDVRSKRIEFIYYA